MSENYDRINKGFRLLHPMLAGFIGREMRREYKDGWWDEIRYVLNNPNDIPVKGEYADLIDSLDIANCLRLIDREWNDVFYRSFGSINYRSWSKELMGIRNSNAHIGQRDFDNSYTERALDTMALLCEGIDKETAYEIRKIYNELRYADAPAVVKEVIKEVVTTPDSPTDIDIPSEKETPDIKEGEIINLLDLIGTDIVQKTTLTKKITFNGETKAYPVYKVRLDKLYYNDQNDRIATWIEKYQAENGENSLLLLEPEKYNSVIEDFIFKSNPDAMRKTQNNIEAFGQREPGVALPDGRIVDGNRRYTCLRRIQSKSKEVLYFETIILDADIQRDSKVIKRLELAIQLGEEKKVDYDLIDLALGTYRTILKKKTLTIEEYAADTGETKAEIQKRLDTIAIIDEFLEYIGLPGWYETARYYQVYSVFQEMMVSLKKLPEEEKNQLKRIVFNNIITKAEPDQRKFIRDINKLVKNDNHRIYFTDQMNLDRELHDAFDAIDVKSEKDIETFAKDNRELAARYRQSLENGKHYSRIQILREQPAESIAQSTKLISGVDRKVIDHMDVSQKKELRKQMEKLSSMVDDYKIILEKDCEKAEDNTGDKVKPENITEDKYESVSEYRLSEINTSVPLAVCVNAGRVKGNTGVLKFAGIAQGKGVSGKAEYRCFFVESSGRAVSDKKEFELAVREVADVELTIINATASLRLVVQYVDGKHNEAVMIIPFEREM